MKAIIMTSRFPWPSFTGDRTRAVMWIDALGGDGAVTLVAPAGSVPAGYEHVRHVVARRSLRRMFAGMVAVAARRLPLQSLLAAGYDWRRAMTEAGEADATIVVLSRLHPWVSPLQRAGVRVLDAVDSLAFSAAERSRAARALGRRFWMMESDRNLELERSLGRDYDLVVVVSDTELDAFGGAATTLPSGVLASDIEEPERDFDFGFWGRLGYFANDDAARILLDTIWPRIRAELPEARLLIAGAEAAGWLRRRSGRAGVTLLSPVADMNSAVSRIRVALFPVRFGTGQLNKVMEGAAAGCSIVATPRAMAGLPGLADSAAIAEEPARFADAAVDAWRTYDSGHSQAVRAAVGRHYGRREALDRMANAVHTALAGDKP